MASGTGGWTADEVRSAKGYTMAEINEYLEGIRCGSALPVYWHRSEVARTPMTALIPPYLEDAFFDARRREGRHRVYPHALLVRDFGPVEDVDDAVWWRAFWDESEVEEAKRNRRVWEDFVPVDEVAEHGDVPLSCQDCCRFRVCEMSASFERGRQLPQAYNMWLWSPFYANPHGFAELACLVNLVRLKQMIWRRYHFFFDADTLQEVYPENELANWVIEAWKNEEIATPEWRDEELSYEVRNCCFSNVWPCRLRSFEDEKEVQERRAMWRKADVHARASELPYNCYVERRIYEGEELPRCLVEADEAMRRDRAAFWARKRSPDRAQHDAEEPNMDVWEKAEMEARKRKKVRRAFSHELIAFCHRSGFVPLSAVFLVRIDVIFIVDCGVFVRLCRLLTTKRSQRSQRKMTKKKSSCSIIRALNSELDRDADELSWELLLEFFGGEFVSGR